MNRMFPATMVAVSVLVAVPSANAVDLVGVGGMHGAGGFLAPGVPRYYEANGLGHNWRLIPGRSVTYLMSPGPPPTYIPVWRTVEQPNVGTKESWLHCTDPGCPVGVGVYIGMQIGPNWFRFPDGSVRVVNWP